MSNQQSNKIYESFDIISQEMAKKIVQENRHKLTSKDNTDFYKTISPIDENETNEKGRNNQKKWTITTQNIFMSQNKLKKKNHSNKNVSNINNNNPLMDLYISTIKQEEEKKIEKNEKIQKISSSKKNIINNISSNQNSKEINKFNPSPNPKENKILILRSEETSNSLSENNNSSVTNKTKKEKEKEKEKNNSKIINEKDNKEVKEVKEIKEVKEKEKGIVPEPRRKSVQLVMRFSPKKNYNDEEKNVENSYSKSKSSSSSKNKTKSNIKEEEINNSSSEKLDKRLNSSNLLEELSKDEEKFELPNADQDSFQRKQNKKHSTRNFIISPLDSDFKIFSKKKPKNKIKLQKISLKNMIIYKPKRTPKQFYEHEIFLQKRKERINDSKKNKKIVIENMNYQSIPTINPVSVEIINQTENYVPIMKRSVEYKNQKNYKNILNEKVKEKEIKDKIKASNIYVLDKAEEDVLYWRQKFWQKRVEEKLNKSSYKKQKLKEIEEENKYLKYKLQINSRSYSRLETRSKYYHTTINDNNLNTNINDNYKPTKKINVFERLYRDGKSHEKKMRELTKSYFNTLFKPNINHSFTLPSRNIKVTKSYKKQNQNNNKRKINNINKYSTKNKKKIFSIIYEDINTQKNKSRNKIKNENLTSIDSTKPSRNTNNTSKQRLSIEFDNLKKVKSRILNKEFAPIPIKLGEIKEADNDLSETTKRNNMKENKINDNNNDINNINDNTNKIITFQSNKLISSAFNKKKEENKNSFKEQSSSQEKLDSQQSNDINNIKIKRKSSSNVRQSNFKNILKENTNINKSIKKNEKENKEELSFIQDNNDINKNNNNSPSFNSLIRKEKNNVEDILVLNNSSENILQESGSFGNYQYSNLISKENIFQENEKETKRQKSKKRIEKKNTKPKNNKNTEEDEENKKININIKKIKDYNFNPFENQKSKDDDSISSEETSSIKEEEDIIQKIRNIEMKEERNKIDKMIEGKNKKNKKNEKKEKLENELYMINWRNCVSNATQEPFIYKDTKGIFFDFFKKN